MIAGAWSKTGKLGSKSYLMLLLCNHAEEQLLQYGGRYRRRFHLPSILNTGTPVERIKSAAAAM